MFAEEPELDRAERVQKEQDYFQDLVNASRLVPQQQSQPIVATRPQNNFDGDKMNQWRLSAIAAGSDCKQFEQLSGGRVSVKYWYMHEIEIESRETGEINRATRVVFIDDALHGVSFVSEGIIQSLGIIRAIFGDGPYDPPLQFEVKQIKTQSGRKTYTVTPIE